MPGVCMNVAALDGGVAFNVIPERVSLTFSVRPPPGFDRPAFDRDLVSALAAATLEEGPTPRLSFPIDRPPFATRDLAAFEPLLGQALAGAGPIDFWTEAAVLSLAGVDAVVIGPGHVDQAHAADEHVPVDDLAWAVDLYARAFARGGS